MPLRASASLITRLRSGWPMLDSLLLLEQMNDGGEHRVADEGREGRGPRRNRGRAEEDVGLDGEHGRAEDERGRSANEMRPNADGDPTDQEEGFESEGHGGEIPQTEADLGRVVEEGKVGP